MFRFPHGAWQCARQWWCILREDEGESRPLLPPVAPEAGLGLSGSRAPQNERGPQRVYRGTLLVSALIRLSRETMGRLRGAMACCSAQLSALLNVEECSTSPARSPHLNHFEKAD